MSSTCSWPTDLRDTGVGHADVREAARERAREQGLYGREGCGAEVCRSPLFSWGGEHHKTTTERKGNHHHWPFSERGRCLLLGSVPATRPGVRLDPGGRPSQVTVLTPHCKRAREGPVRTKSRLPAQGHFSGP